MAEQEALLTPRAGAQQEGLEHAAAAIPQHKIAVPSSTQDVKVRVRSISVLIGCTSSTHVASAHLKVVFDVQPWPL